MSSNLDSSEIEKFDQMASQWWDLEGPCKPLHQLNPIRLSFIKSCIALEQLNILDVGCGGGILTESLSLFSPHVTGIDGSQKAITVAKEHATALKQKPHYACVTAEEYAQDHKQAFDVITCMELIEHVPSPVSLIEALALMLKPNGHLFLSTLNRTPKAFMFAIVFAEYVLNLLPKGTHDYEKFIQPSEMISWARPFNLKIKTLKGMDYRPLMKTFELSDSLSVNYLAHFTKTTP